MIKMFSQKDYKMSVYSDSSSTKNTYRTLIWVHNMNFCSTKSFYSETWMPILNNGSYYTRRTVCQQLLFLSSKKETIRVDTHTQCIVVIMTLTYMITDTLTMAGSRLRSSVVKNFGSLFQLFGKSLIKSFMLAILFRMQRVI